MKKGITSCKGCKHLKVDYKGIYESYKNYCTHYKIAIKRGGGCNMYTMRQRDFKKDIIKK